MRYISTRNISFSLPVNGVDKRVRFTPCMQSGSIYVTTDVDEIKALEENEMFGRVYMRHPDCENEEVEQPKAGKKKSKAKLTEVPEVTNWQEAKDYLVEKFGLDSEALLDPSSIAQAAEDNKVAFINIEQ